MNSAFEEWEPYLKQWWNQYASKTDVGKFLSPVSELFVAEFIKKKTGRNCIVVGQKTYDAVSPKQIFYPEVRLQIKLRTGTWHLETTRRVSKKNKDTSQSGHVAYRTNEFDALAIFIPGDNFGVNKSCIRIIPTKELIDPKHPHQLVRNISKKIRDKYDNDEATDRVISELYLNFNNEQPILY